MAGLYLASQSPRRTELLTQVGIDHTVVSSTYEESNEGYDNPIEMVKAQALGKARCAVGVPDGSIVLGADTIVVLDNKESHMMNPMHAICWSIYRVEHIL